MKPLLFLLGALLSLNLVAASSMMNPASAASTATSIHGKINDVMPLKLVEVGDKNNPEDPKSHYGNVQEAFQISSCDFTADQYRVVLNSVAKHADPYHLYDERMSTDANVASITRTGDSTTGYTYQVKSKETANLPITYVSWFSAARCINFLHNSALAGHLLSGNEDSSTTEKGVYDLTAPVKVVTRRYLDFLNTMATSEDINHLHKNLYQDENLIHDIVSCVKADDGKYVYSFKEGSDVASLPSHLQVSWASAARFSNWKYNTETVKNPRHYSQDELTEKGLFTIADGLKDITGDADVVPTDYAKVSPNAKYFLPTENQWHKAAYYKRNKTGIRLNADYYIYPTSKDIAPANHIVEKSGSSVSSSGIARINTWNMDPLNSGSDALRTDNADNLANYYIDDALEDQKFATGDKKPHLTPVGFFSKTQSPYGLFDMAGNVSQWLSGTPGHYVTFSYDKDGHITKSDLAKLDNNGEPLLVSGVTAEKEEFDAEGHVMKKDADDHILLQWQYAGVTRPIRGGCWGKEGQCPTGAEQFANTTVMVIDGSVKRDYIGFRIAAPAN